MTHQLIEENNLLKSKVASLQTALDQIGTYVFTKNRQGQYTYVNHKVCDLFNLPAEKILGLDDSHFFSLEQCDDIKKNDNIVITQGATVEKEEKNIVNSTGKVTYCITTKKPIRDDDGNIIGLLGVSTDITERKKMELALKEKQNILDSILNNIDAFIYMKDKEFRYEYVNLRVSEIYGTDIKEIIGKKDQDILPPQIADQFHNLDKKVFTSKQKQSGEERVMGIDGKARYYWFNNIPIKNARNEVDRYIGFSTDITELSQLRNNLQEQVEHEINRRQRQEHLAITDRLTSLYNRAKLDQELINQVHQAQIFEQEFGVIMVDLDNFKQVNDTYGHQAGDVVLVDIATLLRKNIRQIDILGRWGGEEFMIICPDTNLEGLNSLAEKMRIKVAEHKCPIVGNRTISLGISSFQSNDSLESIVAKADAALYKAKKNGKNRTEQLKSLPAK